MSEYPYGAEGRAASTPDFIATEGRVKGLGAQVGGHAPSVGSLAEKTGAIHVDFPHFGFVGVRANLAHNEARAGAVKALNAGRAVLESWQEALAQTEKNYQAADDGAGKTIDDKTKNIDDKNKHKGPGGDAEQAAFNGSGSGNTPSPPSSDVNVPEFPGSNMKSPASDSDVNAPEFPGSNMKSPASDSDVNAPEFPDPDTKSPASDSDVNIPEFPDPDTKPPASDSDVNAPEFPGPNTKPPALPEMPNPNDPANIPGLDRDALEDIRNRADDLDPRDPRQTDLSAYNPSDMPNALNLPDMPNTPNTLNLPNVPTPQSNVPDLKASLGDQAGVDSSTRAGGSSGGPSSIGGSLNGTRAASANGANGANGMPFMPPMGGAPGGGEQRNKEGSSIRQSEDESVWGGDEGISPAVLRQEE